MRKHLTSSQVLFTLGFCLAMAATSIAQLTTLHTFNGNDGMNPYRMALTQGIDGTFYGTTEKGGTDNFGVVFKMTPDGTVTVLHEFVGTDGEYPSSGLIQDAEGNLYGTTRTGGPGPDPGVVYKITPQGSFTILTAGVGSVNYRAAHPGQRWKPLRRQPQWREPGDGTVFELRSADGTNATVLYTFCTQSNCPDGAHPLGGMAEGTDHNLYGTAEYGGANGDYGVVFRITPSGTYTRAAQL